MASGFLAAAIASGGGFLPRQMRFDPRFELTAQHFFFFIFDFPPFFFFLPERYPPRDSPFQFSSIAVLHTLSKKDRRNEYRKSVRFDFFQSWLPAFAFLLIAGRREIAGERKLDWEPLFPVSTWPIVIDRLLVERETTVVKCYSPSGRMDNPSPSRLLHFTTRRFPFGPRRNSTVIV